VNDAVLHAIRTRRVVRALTDAPVGHDQLRALLDSARYAPHAGNRRLHRYAVAPGLRPCVRCGWSYPGMLQRLMTAIVVCVDWAQVHNYGFSPANPGPYIDVGTAAETLVLAAHSIGSGAEPVTSFGRTALATILNLPLECVPS
jgi:nitroreductase